MGKKSRQKKAKKNQPHPTFFVLEGSIRCYDQGSMLELNTQISQEEWQEILIETIKYKIFLDCLKEVAYPILHESWSTDDEYFRIMLEHNLTRMRDIDPMFFVTINQSTIKTEYESKMRKNASLLVEDIKKIKDEHRTWLNNNSDHGLTNVSEL